MQLHKTTFVYRHCSHLYFPKMKQSLYLTQLISGADKRKEKGVLERWHSASEVVTSSISPSPAFRGNVNHGASAIFCFFPLPSEYHGGCMSKPSTPVRAPGMQWMLCFNTAFCRSCLWWCLQSDLLTLFLA